MSPSPGQNISQSALLCRRMPPKASATLEVSLHVALQPSPSILQCDPKRVERVVFLSRNQSPQHCQCCRPVLSRQYARDFTDVPFISRGRLFQHCRHVKT
ncbi:hypothetical protein DOTSEDRAFT_75551 [Dothistroma septosporum NZE10]|uniref:Uncharacterized protein n=1 Tax=Dothistroma septosporum (strain NZE10 / CBS 128990) TaxID=675120 RepID=M2XHF4_DOTSN|nr:hypothetical protein DOTSEDRAFT_75551 [Dothistroma septosporum NZE10]